METFQFVPDKPLPEGVSLAVLAADRMGYYRLRVPGRDLCLYPRANDWIVKDDTVYGGWRVEHSKPGSS